MHDQRDGSGDRGGPRDGGGDDRSREHQQRPEGGGPDTRFLQLEMSRVMYAEAEEVAKPAFRELLLEAAKERLRERFGDRITALARLAVDELLNDAQASLDVEARIQRYHEERRAPAETLRDLFARGHAGGDSTPERHPRASRRSRRKR
jgi:hypothetical protein